MDIAILVALESWRGGGVVRVREGNERSGGGGGGGVRGALPPLQFVACSHRSMLSEFGNVARTSESSTREWGLLCFSRIFHVTDGATC